MGISNIGIHCIDKKHAPTYIEGEKMLRQVTNIHPTQ